MLSGISRRTARALASQPRFNSASTISRWLLKERYGLDTPPTKGQMTSHFSAVFAACGADGLDPAESEYVRGLGDTFNLEPSVLDALERKDWDDKTLELVCTSYARSRLNEEYWKRFLLYDAIAACWGDQVYSEEERAKVKRIGDLLGLSPELVQEIEQLYEQEHALRVKRLALLKPGQ
eukprot:Hpha_TRINITY_DN9048_c0_g1::TRINITY_DN9048_c0_g1_i1::g.141901::m.141901